MIIGEPFFDNYLVNARLKSAWSDLLLKIDSKLGWCWFMTLTFRGEFVFEERAEKSFNMFIHKLNRKTFGVRYTKRGQGVWWCKAKENHKFRQMFHYHCLVGGCESQRRLTWMDIWNNMEGFARILPYDKNKGARFYISKYISKGGEIDIYVPKAVQWNLI